MITALLVVALSQVSSQPQPPQAPPRDAAPAPAGDAVLRGRVIASDTGAPVRECSVVLMPRADRPLTARTDAQGRFVFRQVPAGSYRLRANATTPSARYLAGVYGGNDPRDIGKTIDIAATQVIEGLEIRLPRAAAFAGRVVDEFGEPVAFVRVNALERVAGGEPRRSGGFMMNGTDDLGQFRVFGLMPGEYILVAEPQRFGGPPDDNPVRHLPTYMPSTLVIAEAASVRVRAGQEIGDLEIRLLRGRTFKVTGTITNSRGEPFTRRMGHLSFVEEKFGGGMSSGVDLREDGTFEIRGVKPGSYALQVSPMRSGPDDDPGADAEFAHMLVAVLDSDVEGVALVTHSGASVSGEVVYDEPPPPSAQPALVGAPPVSRRMFNSWSQAKVASDGTFVLRGLFQRRVIRLMSPPRGYWLSAVTLDGVDITDKPTEFKPGATSRVVITMTRRMAELSGRVLDGQGKPRPETAVLAFSDDRAQWFQAATTTRFGGSDDKGEYRLNGLRAGTYLIIALPRDKRPPELDEGADAWEALAKQASVVTVGDNERKTVDLKLIADIDR